MASASAPQIRTADSIEQGMAVAPFTVSRSRPPLGLAIRGARVVVNVLIACWTILFYDTLASSMEDNHGSLVRTFLAMFLYIGLPNRAYEEFDQVFRKMRLSDVQLKTLARTEGPLTSPELARAEHIWKDFITRDERVAYGTTGGCCIGVSAACIQYLSDTSLRHHHILSRLHILSMFIVLEALVLKLVLYKCVQGAMQERRHMWMWRTAMHPLVRPGALWNEWIALTMPLVLAYWGGVLFLIAFFGTLIAVPSSKPTPDDVDPIIPYWMIVIACVTVIVGAVGYFAAIRTMHSYNDDEGFEALFEDTARPQSSLSESDTAIHTPSSSSQC